jgi:hypothetical protein
MSALAIQFYVRNASDAELWNIIRHETSNAIRVAAIFEMASR